MKVSPAWAGHDRDAQARVAVGCGLLIAFVLMCVALLGMASVAEAAPANDDFGNAAPLVGFPVSVEAWNEGATVEPGEQTHGFVLPRSLWWRWEAPQSGPVAVETCESNVGAEAGVYTGGSLTSLARIGSEPDGSWCEGAYGTRVAFFATAGQTYRIAVVTGEASGTVRLGIVRAGTASVRLLEGKRGPLARLVYRAAPGEENDPDISLDWDPTSGRFRWLPEPPSVPVGFSIDPPLAPGPGCTIEIYMDCAIPAGARPVGPLVLLGDRDDGLLVDFSRAGTEIFGGPGSDVIASSGVVRGGPGNDEIRARPWSHARIRGGAGDDFIAGSLKRDVINPGPGEDIVQPDPQSHRDVVRRARDLINTRDGDGDRISCFGAGTFLIDGVDNYPDCGGVVRRAGAARAIPEWVENDGDQVEVSVACPPDGPRVCAGSLSVSGHGVVLRRGFRMRHEFGVQDYSTIQYFSIEASERRVRALTGDVTVTVRSRDRSGRLRKASLVVHDV